MRCSAAPAQRVECPWPRRCLIWLLDTCTNTLDLYMGFRSLCQKVHMKERMKERISCNHRHDHQLSHALLLRLTNTCIDQDTVASVSDRPGNGPGTAQEPAFCGGPRPMTPACWAPSRDEPGCLWIVHCDSLYYPSNGTAVASLTPYVLPSLCQYSIGARVRNISIASWIRAS